MNRPIEPAPATVNRPPIWGRPYLANLLQSRGLCLLIPGTFLTGGYLHMLRINPWQCPLRASVGLPCPGCGLSRSFEAGIFGQWDQMLTFHPLSPMFAGLFALMLCCGVLPERSRQRLIAMVRRAENAWSPFLIFSIVLILFSALRLAGVYQTPAS